MRVDKVTLLSDGGKEIWVLPEDHNIPGHRAGQYVSIALEEGADGAATMVTAHIREVSTRQFRLQVPYSEERATQRIIRNVAVGDELYIGIPCGKAAPTR